jgi:hypothetical protein
MGGVRPCLVTSLSRASGAFMVVVVWGSLSLSHVGVGGSIVVEVRAGSGLVGSS